MPHTSAINILAKLARKLEQKIPSSIHRHNDYWKGYKDAIEEL